jgi:hypothetical protein
LIAAASDNIIQAVFRAKLIRLASECLIVVPSCWDWVRSAPVEAAQDVGYQIAGYCNFGKLENDVSTVLDHCGLDLDQLLPERSERLTGLI